MTTPETDAVGRERNIRMADGISPKLPGRSAAGSIRATMGIGIDKQGRPCRRIPLPVRCRPRYTAPKFRCRRLNQIEIKLLIYMGYQMLVGCISEANKRFFPCRQGNWEDGVSHGPTRRASVHGHRLQ